MLLPQTHSPEVDYSLFIMETVEMSMEKKETSLAGLRRSFPPPIFSLLISVFWFLSCGGPPLEKRRGTSYIGVFRSRDASGRRIDANGATRAKLSGPTQPGTVAAWDPLVWSSGLRSLTSFAPKSSPSKIMTLLKFIAHHDVVKVLKHIKKEIGVFCLRRINSIKRGNHY